MCFFVGVSVGINAAAVFGATALALPLGLRASLNAGNSVGNSTLIQAIALVVFAHVCARMVHSALIWCNVLSEPQSLQDYRDWIVLPLYAVVYAGFGYAAYLKLHAKLMVAVAMMVGSIAVQCGLLKLSYDVSKATENGSFTNTRLASAHLEIQQSTGDSEEGSEGSGSVGAAQRINQWGSGVLDAGESV